MSNAFSAQAEQLLLRIEQGDQIDLSRLSPDELPALAAAAAGCPDMYPERYVRLVSLAYDRLPFLYYAIDADRPELVGAVLPLCQPPRPWVARLWELPLLAAVERGRCELLRPLVSFGARVSQCLYDDGLTPLHRAVLKDNIAPSARAELVHELLRLGAVPELHERGGMDVYALAQTRGERETLAVLREHGVSYGPRQSREARRAGIRDVCLTYHKAAGFIYRVGQPDLPFVEGGDYDGAFPCDAERAVEVFERLTRDRGYDLDWFEPFLHRIVTGEEFAFDELKKYVGKFSLHLFSERNNWG